MKAFNDNRNKRYCKYKKKKIYKQILSTISKYFLYYQVNKFEISEKIFDFSLMKNKIKC